jgi:CheY-like chemotaxis protein
MARILIVDDDADVRFMMRIILERAGHFVDEAGDGAQALAYVNVTRPDLVLTDFVMRVMSGQELIARIRSNPETSAIPVVGVTGHSIDESAADTVVDKPFDPGRLVDVVEMLLAGKINGRRGSQRRKG